ncbi:MAG: prolipoprotein diacylglyceryl transferase [Actinobacteria bacterium]|nr:prolipoprotein diacylglyceryl transferase [Actinomycetota bacterium]
MKPIPVVFHIGPLQVHTYGIGLAITFWFAFKYFERRLRNNGYSWQWLTPVFVWVVVAAVIGARVMHVLANLAFYVHQPIQVFEVWHGGLSSFGGLLGGVPTGVILARRRCPELKTVKALDLVTPVLIAAWGVGRLLGPQLMVAGGGHPTHQWFGMYYADEVGKRLPVPIFQSFDSFVIFGILLWVERRYKGRIDGMVLAVGVGLWGVARFFEEYLWLEKPHNLGAHLVEAAGIGLALAGFTAAALLLRQLRRREGAGAPGSGEGDEGLALAQARTSAAEKSLGSSPELSSEAAPRQSGPTLLGPAEDGL